MGKPKRPVQPGDDAATSEERAERERDRKLGLFVVVVARATHEGRLPISQTEIKRELKRDFKLDLPGSSVHNLGKVLKHEFNNKVWVKIDGQKVTLFSEGKTLVDSRAVRALFIARKNLNDDGVIEIERWKELCLSELRSSNEACDDFVHDFQKCRYTAGPGSDGLLELDLRAIGEDEFYLKQAAKAGIKKSVARNRSAKP